MLAAYKFCLVQSKELWADELQQCQAGSTFLEIWGEETWELVESNGSSIGAHFKNVQESGSPGFLYHPREDEEDKTVINAWDQTQSVALQTIDSSCLWGQDQQKKSISCLLPYPTSKENRMDKKDQMVHIRTQRSCRPFGENLCSGTAYQQHRVQCVQFISLQGQGPNFS